MNRLPMTVISGYLGAGKTTLINRMLADPQGLRLMVMVNDFGAVNIDAALIASRDKDVIALTNGCVCCTMGADLFMALGDALDRRPRPDHLIVEASGIANPKSIANAALAEPELRYAGVITLVDAMNIGALLTDPLVAPQVQQQITAADIVVQTKSTERISALDALFRQKGLCPPDIIDAGAISSLALACNAPDATGVTTPHPSYVSWHEHNDKRLDHAGLTRALASRPAGLYRLKGFVRTTQGTFEIQIVGKQHELKPITDNFDLDVVGLGLHGRITKLQIASWWQSIGKA